MHQSILIGRLPEREANKEAENDKLDRVDILAKDARQQFIIIGLQYNREVDYFQVLRFGVSKMIAYRIKISKKQGISRRLTIRVPVFTARDEEIRKRFRRERRLVWNKVWSKAKRGG